MNTKLLREVKTEILKEPGRFLMEGWVDSDAAYSPCGTAACIGGWALVLDKAGKRITKQTFPGIARAIGHTLPTILAEDVQEVLDINVWQMNRLCGLGYWPTEFEERYEAARPGSRERAQVAAERIEHFIKTKGAE